MKASEIITAARDLLQDIATEAADQRWTDASFVVWVNDVVGDIRRKRADSLYDDEGDAIDITTTTEADLAEGDDEDDVCLADRWRTACVNYLCHRAFLRDAEDPENRRMSESYLTLYKQEVYGV